MADNTIVTVSLGLVTILASGLTSSWVTHRLNKNHNQTIFLREKAETLYLAADEYGSSVAGMAVSYLPLLEGRYDYNTMLDQQISSGSKKPENGGAKTMTMIVDIYFPTVRPALENVWEARAAFNKVTGAIKAAWQEAEFDGVRLLEGPFRSAALDFNKAINELKREIVEAARIQSGVKQPEV
ncbi:hypothetical protein [Sphingobium yanoikuyae]|uniref:hypothetical protein n=1 Tax=Sphingobium yanoikuyae TaxID=13690 RepID=UPI000262B5AD|nr:hypothetical protein [Sphingobium yanoikuyae]